MEFKLIDRAFCRSFTTRQWRHIDDFAHGEPGSMEKLVESLTLGQAIIFQVWLSALQPLATKQMMASAARR